MRQPVVIDWNAFVCLGIFPVSFQLEFRRQEVTRELLERREGARAHRELDRAYVLI
jgi:hypothetical protein